MRIQELEKLGLRNVQLPSWYVTHGPETSPELAGETFERLRGVGTFRAILGADAILVTPLADKVLGFIEFKNWLAANGFVCLPIES